MDVEVGIGVGVREGMGVGERGGISLFSPALVATPWTLGATELPTWRVKEGSAL